MAEIKNTFLKSKMNKDLDERLLPNGEYRDAQNIAISKSEDSNVGAAENVQGTELVLNGDIGKIVGDVLSTIDPLVIIGQYADEVNSRIYLFLTDNFVEKLTYIKSSQNAIVRYDIDNGNIYIYSAGTFLNFSTGYQIRNVNLIEDLMFWTDNRNQPRVININNPDATLIANFTSIADLPYTTEDQITVCKYNPYKPIEVWKDNGGVIETTMVDAVSSTSPMIAQVQMADNIGSPVAPQEINVDTGTYTPGMSDALAVAEGFQIWTSDGQITPEDNVYVVSSPAPGTFVIAQRDGTNFQARFEAFGLKPVMLYFGYPNPNWDNNAGDPTYPGNQDFLTDKFVRFSYRFKFTDGEFSLMAPFTQICFIPKQYGYFLEGIVTPTGDEVSDETRTYESTVVSFMENLVNRIFLQIPMPDGIDGSQLDANELLDVLNIEEIELLYKESDSLAVQVVDKITTEQLNTAGAVTTYEYDYLATEPFKTLPEDQTTRVYDKVPVKALGQEIISNRIVYSNFQNKHTPPVALDYNVGVSSKIPYDEANSNYSYSAYPNHTVKQNRYYQVGIVLSDRYGRTSTVLLSNNQSFVAAAAPNPQFGADTIYVPYQNEYDTQNFNNIVDWPGNSLKIYFNNIIDSAFNPELGTPGLYNGDPTSSDYNPLGWYTYKVVVKQKQQDYYNVYLPGILTGLPEDTPNYPDGEIYTSTITLFNDNINKVPRDLKEVGPDQAQYRSSVELFGRVSPELPVKPNVAPITLPLYNTQYLPELVPDITTQIARQSDLFQSQYWQDATVAFDVLADIYDSTSNPYLARVSTQKLIGSGGNQNPPAPDPYPFFLSVYETKPVESKLELFWETSTTGKILDLNNAINTTVPSIPAGIENFAFNFVEDRNYTNPVQVYTTGQGPVITNDFYVEDALGSALNNTSLAMTIIDGNGVDVTASVGITLVETPAGLATPNGAGPFAYDSYTLQISEYFVFLSNSQIRNWELYFVATNDATGDIGPTINLQLTLDNAAPGFNPPGAGYRVFPYNSFGAFPPPPASNPVYDAANGTSNPDPAINQDEIIYSIIEQSQYGSDVTIFNINPDTGEISQAPQTIMSGPYFIKVAATDALGTSGSLTTIIELNWDFGEPSVTCTFIDSGEAINFLEGSDAGLAIWSNKSTGLTVPGYDGDRPGSAGNPSNPSYDTAAWNRIPDPTNPVNVSNYLYGSPSTAGFNFDVKSLDLSDGPNWCTLSGSDRGLLKGIAYITVSLVQTIDPSTVGLNTPLPGILDLFADVWIQRRTEGGIAGPWTNAIDIEGQVVGDDSAGLPIGGEWLVNYPNQNPLYALNQGSLFATSEIAGYPQPYEDHNLKASMALPQSAASDQLTVVATRTFAFSGNDPATRGGYRVMINNVNGTQTEWPNPTTPVGNTGVYNNENCKFSITYGDFYYPFGITNITWRYLVMTVAEPDAISAANYTGVQWTEVFAREPFFRYVTQFYTNAELTDTWTPQQAGTNRWHGYKARASAGVGGAGNPNGNDGAAETPLNTFTPSISNPQANRIWIATFSSTGSKTGLSYPKSI